MMLLCSTSAVQEIRNTLVLIQQNLDEVHFSQRASAAGLCLVGMAPGGWSARGSSAALLDLHAEALGPVLRAAVLVAPTGSTAEVSVLCFPKHC